MTIMWRVSVCCLCMCLAGLVGTDGFDSGIIVLSQGGNKERVANDATLLVVMAVLELTIAADSRTHCTYCCMCSTTFC